MIRNFLVLLLMLMNVSCSNLLGPDDSTGSIIIVFANPQLSATLKKPVTELKRVDCFFKKGDRLIRKFRFEKVQDRFQGEIKKLKTGSNYSITLHGFSYLNRVVTYATKSNIKVNNHTATKVELQWDLFIPTPLSPDDDETVNDPPFLFLWKALPEADGYELKIDDDPNIRSPFIEQRLADTSYIHNEDLANGTYYWKVIAKGDTDLWGLWSDINVFHVN